MIKKKEMVSFTGPMVENIKAAGKMVSSMESVPTHPQVVRPSRANGLKVKDFTGSLMMENDTYTLETYSSKFSTINNRFFVKYCKSNRIWWIFSILFHLNCFGAN